MRRTELEQKIEHLLEIPPAALQLLAWNTLAWAALFSSLWDSSRALLNWIPRYSSYFEVVANGESRAW